MNRLMLHQSRRRPDGELCRPSHQSPAKVAGGHGGHVSGHRGENGMDVGQRRAAGWTNLGGRDYRDCRTRF